MNKKTVLLLAALGGSIPVWSQSLGPVAFNSAGGSAVVASNTQEWSIGEMLLISTYTSANLVVTQGLLQPSAGPNGIHDPLVLTSSQLQVYPNPTRDVLTLQTQFKEGEILSCSLTDMKGKAVLQQEISVAPGTDLKTLSLASMAAGNYVLHVSVAGKSGTTSENNFKVQKIQ